MQGSIWTGLFLLAIGGVLLLNQMGFPFPDWLFNWHVLLICIGLFVGLRHQFHGTAWFILICIGGFFLMKDYDPTLQVDRYIWPAVLIGVGLLIIMRPHRGPWRDRRWHKGMMWDDWKKDWKHGPSDPDNDYRRGGYTSEDFLDSTAIFGGSHKRVVSKNFKGGDVTSIMGGTEIDLTQADISGTVRLDVTQIMGGTKIIVPAHWEVRSQVTAIFAGFEDKRQQPAVLNPDKVLILEGTSIFGGIELRNF
jgi:predicted membrane protein